MKVLSVLLPVLFLLSFVDYGNSQSLPVLNNIRDIRLLVSNREDVSRLMNNHAEFRHSPGTNREWFSLENENIEFTYSSGKCSDGDEEWNVPGDVVTSITIEPKDRLTKESLGLDFSTFRKQRTDPQRKSVYVLHNKSRGIAVGVFGGRIDALYLFPGSGSHSSLCDKPEVRAYYKSKRWTREPIPKKLIIDYNTPANVVGLTITPEEVNSKRFVVLVDAKDPENDILTYRYSTSAGKIIGTGQKVVWDLTEAPSGTYKLTAAVDDGCGICGKYISRTVVIN